MAEPEKISATEASKKAKTGKAHLVCAYDDDEKFQKLRLEGAISLQEFASYLPFITKKQEIVFY